MFGRSGGTTVPCRCAHFHCICHRLALACCDSGNETEYIREVEGILTQIWKFF